VTAFLKARAVANGQDIANAAVYGNYAIIHTPVDDIYKGNLPRLRSIKAVYDPDNVMGLTGGYKF
jgi:Berberine and berberine like